MDEDKKNNSGWIVLFIIIFIFVAVKVWNNFSNKPEYFDTEGMSSYTTEKRDDWELSLYSSENPNTDFLMDKIKGFSSKDTCLAEGVSRRIKGGSFECSYKCKTQYTNIGGYKDQVDICEKVCDDGGCRD